MDVLYGLKDLQDESSRVRRMYAEAHPQADLHKEAMVKSGEAILPTRDGLTACGATGLVNPVGLRHIQHQRKLLALSAQAVVVESGDRSMANPVDP